MELTPQAVDAYKQILLDPEKFKMDFKPLDKIIAKSENVTAQYILFKQFIEVIKKPLPKLMFYIIMAEIYGQPNAKDENGDLGWALKVIN